jgi:hypothetical protein
MRKLGQGQSVLCCITQEIEGKIRTCSKRSSGALANIDVVKWAISETHAEMKRSVPLWVMQSERFVSHEPLWKQIQADDQYTVAPVQAREFREREAQTLDDRYRPRLKNPQHTLSRLSSAEDPRLQLIGQRCQRFNDISLTASTLQEEQERELSPETELEYHVYRPTPAEALEHGLHKYIKEFASTGKLSKSFTLASHTTAFMSLSETSLAQLIDTLQLGGDAPLLASWDFARSVKVSDGCLIDDYQKSVQWVLSNRGRGSTVIT